MPSAPSVTISVEEAISWVKTEAPEYLAGAQDETLRSRMLLKLLSKYGRVSYNQAGSHMCIWTIQVKEPPIQSHGAYGEFTFDEHDCYEQLAIDWRGYLGTDKMSEKHKAIASNGNGLVIIDYYDQAIPRLERSMRNRFHKEMFVDGYADGNDDRWCGLDSCMGTGTNVVADLVGQPSDTYGGLSTALNGIGGGTWSTDLASASRPNAAVATDWPWGTGSTQYDANSPLQINTTSTSWPASSNVWADNVEFAIRQALNWQENRGGPDNRPKCCLWAGDLYTPIQNYFSARFRDIIPHREADDLGFEGTLNFDGCMMKTEYDVPATTGYGMSMEAIELAFVYSSMWETEGPEKDMKSDSILFKIRSFGNVRLRPKGLVKFKSYAS